ncbi:MAG: hypothetical protein K2J79_05705 [Ruminiclostridium sp.]|nr:hypothetical protein [Ruminiclostridium sp.]
MAKKQKKPPYSWFRWQMRPRIYEEEQFAPKRSGKESLSEDSEEFQGENGEEELEEIEKEEEQIELEKGDLFAMILSAMITIFPICVGLLLLIVLSAYFLFIH